MAFPTKELPKVERLWGSLLSPEIFPRRLNCLEKFLLGESSPSLWATEGSLRNTACPSFCKGGTASLGQASPTLKAEP